jgi:hypothetical protein
LVVSPNSGALGAQAHEGRGDLFQAGLLLAVVGDGTPDVGSLFD